MRKLQYILFLALLLGVKAFGASGNLTAYLRHAAYNTASGKSYVETYLNVMGNTVKFKGNSDGTYESKVKVTIAFLRADSTIANANSYNLHSQQIKDTTNKPDYIDVQRYWLAQGVYTMHIELKDMNNEGGKTLSSDQKINVGFNTDSIKVADMELLQSYTPSTNHGILSKNGYEMVPYVLLYFPQGVKELKFYTEVYNACKIGTPGDKFIIRYYLENADNKTRINGFNSVLVQQADTVNPILGGFNIEDLGTGNYNLCIDVLDKNNTLKTSRKFYFLRHNPHVEATIHNLATIDVASTFVARMNNKDSLMDDIRGLWPRANISERDFIESDGFKKTDITLLKQFFYNFWSGRNPADPEGEWKQYEYLLLAVNKRYGTPTLKGYQTDRGRIYLKHGPPNHMDKEALNPAYYPYEIWEYYKLEDGEVDKKFVFYMPNSATNEYVLLHSDANNEVHERRWQIILNKRNGTPYDLDINSVDDPFGENAINEFNNPR